MADPGFPIGGGTDLLGGANLRCVHFSAKTYAKMKEMDPVGGGHALVVPPGSANVKSCEASATCRRVSRYTAFLGYSPQRGR